MSFAPRRRNIHVYTEAKMNLLAPERPTRSIPYRT